MKKVVIAVSGAAVLFVTVLLLAGRQMPEPDVPEPLSSNILYYSTANENPSQENIGNSSVPTPSKSDPIYSIRAYNGEIGVFEEGQEVPFQVLQVEVSLLPEEDQKMLEKGITIQGEDRLVSILEDYES